MRLNKRRTASKPISYQSFSSEEDEIEEFDEMIVPQDPFSEEEINNSNLESLSEEEQEQDLDDDDDGEEEEEEEEQPIIPKILRNIKRKKPVIEEDSEEGFSEAEGEDDEEVLKSKPMTKRQRAKFNQEEPEDYLQLPMDTGKKKMLTEEEEQLRKSEVARRRKNQSIQRAEKDKADTINRLLKKQASKAKRMEDGDETAQKKATPTQLNYIQNANGSQLSIPTVFTIQHVFGDIKRPETMLVKICQASGCSNNRKYTAKKSGKFACSLEHYKLVETSQ